MTVLRSVLGVILGYVVGAAATMAIGGWLFGSEANPELGPLISGFIALALVYLLAGFLTAVVSGGRWIVPGILAGVFAIVTTATAIRGVAIEPQWFSFTSVAVGVGSILAGGQLATLVYLRK